MARIRFDVTQVVVTAYCTCGWRELANDRDEARRLALGHEANVHPESRQVREAQRIRETRARQQADRDVRIREDDEKHGD